MLVLFIRLGKQKIDHISSELYEVVYFITFLLASLNLNITKRRLLNTLLYHGSNDQGPGFSEILNYTIPGCFIVYIIFVNYS